jgi:hypothetical protein
MKRLLLIVVVLLAFAACKKATDSNLGVSIQPNNSLDSTVFLNANINGVQWNADSVFANTVRASGNDSGVINLLITAEKKDADSPKTVVLTITNFLGRGKYDIVPPANTATYYLGNNRHYATSGSITITSWANSSLTGNYEFVADSITVTSGSFNVVLP